jgi:hypothetical protein
MIIQMISIVIMKKDIVFATGASHGDSTSSIAGVYAWLRPSYPL